MKLNIVNLTGAPSGECEFADDLVIKNGKGTQAVHDAVVAYLANQRLGTAKVKEIGEVRGSGKKPWRQKHTGRARAGSFASPLWRGGGVVFGPHPRDYSIQVPKKVRTLAFRRVLSERLLAGDVVVVADFKLDSHKTKSLVATVKKLAGDTHSVLIVDEVVDGNLKLSSRNVPKLEVERADSVNCYQLLNAGKVIVTSPALAILQERAGRS